MICHTLHDCVHPQYLVRDQVVAGTHSRFVLPMAVWFLGIQAEDAPRADSTSGSSVVDVLAREDYS